MATFYFDVHDGIDVRDRIGRSLPTRDAARRTALQIAANYARDPDNLDGGGTLVVTVRDWDDAVVHTVRLVCQIDVPGAVIATPAAQPASSAS